MIVEDEVPIRNIISRIIDWKSIGFSLVREADNGLDALNYLSENTVDLVITDISMPFMDGIALCKEIQKNHPSLTVIILTGHNDFEYAQQAIEMNVSNYLLKPITKDSFTQTLEKVKSEMDKRYSDQRNLEFLRSQYNKSKAFLVNKYLMNLIMGYSQSTFKMTDKELELDLEATHYRVGVMSLEDEKNADNEFWGEDRPLLEFAILNLTEELLNGIGEDIVFLGPGNQICMIFKIDDNDKKHDLNRLTATLTDMSVQIEKFFQINATIGLSDQYDHLNELSFAYEDAVIALEYQVLEGSEKVILKSTVENKSSMTLNKVDKQLGHLEYLIKVGDLENIRKVIDYIFSLIHYEHIHIEDFRTMLLKMTLTIFKAYNDIRQESEHRQELDYSIFSKVFEMTDFHEIKKYYLSLCQLYSGRIKDIRENEDKGHVNTAIKYMEANYSDPYLTLESLCNQLFLSPGHFSRLFKKTTTETFVDYLTRLRIDRAKYLLANTNQKMYEISSAIGYEDPNYFSYNFKKNVQLTPSQWRKKGQS